MPTETAILGAGIIGLSTAYYLAQHQPPSTIHVIESSPALFASASGQAGGFLARDWFPPASEALGALSFDEHARLAETHDGARRWGYRRATALSYDGVAKVDVDGPRGEDWLLAGTSRAAAAASGGGSREKEDVEGASVDIVAGGTTKAASPLPWLRRKEGDSARVIGAVRDTAVVEPRQLCQFLLDECVAAGVKLYHPARAVGVLTDEHGLLCGLRLAGTKSDSQQEVGEVSCARLIVTAGAWSSLVLTSLFPQCEAVPVTSLAGHSLVLRSPRWHEELEAQSGCYAVFATSDEGKFDADGAEDDCSEHFSPEFFLRAGGEIWIGGLNSATMPLPEEPASARIEAEAIAVIKREARRLLGGPSQAASAEDDLQVVREGLCFRPVTPRGAPIVARIRDARLGGDVTTRPGAEGGVFLAAGHGPWGISLSLGTGVVLAEMVQGRRLSADVSSLGF